MTKWLDGDFSLWFDTRLIQISLAKHVVGRHVEMSATTALAYLQTYAAHQHVWTNLFESTSYVLSYEAVHKSLCRAWFGVLFCYAAQIGSRSVPGKSSQWV